MNLTKKNIALLLVFSLKIFWLSAIYSQSDDGSIKMKADFIIYAASKITLPQNDANKTYRIGIYGREKNASRLYKELHARSPELTIHEKPLEVLYFRNTRSIEPVDIFYVNGESKIRISDIDQNSDDYPYIILTENFPFGTSMLNFSINKSNNVQFELQPEAIWSKGGKINNKFLNASNRVITKNNWEQLLLASNMQLKKEVIKTERQKTIIEEQTDEIINQSVQIDYQQVIIYVTIAFLLVVMVLAYFLGLANKKRKQAIKNLEEKNTEITDSIKYARIIQNAILPKQDEISALFTEGFILNIPKDIVSGDFYWHTEFKDTAVIAVVDCEGHGVPGAFMSVMANEILNSIINDADIEKPGIILQLIDDRIKESFKDALNLRAESLDLVLITYQKNQNKLFYAGAQRPFVVVRSGELNSYEPTRKVVGGLKAQKNRYYETTLISTKPGDCFYLFTDGIQDQFGGKGNKKFTRKRLYQLLEENAKYGMDMQRIKLNEAFVRWKGSNDQVDDVCLVGIKI
jgi:serine phosphatase RsbU (regulator of sigma subunit)